MLFMSMLRIGDLARLGGVSVRMLRHYHEIGLLVPAHIDEATGYRSYGLGQLDALRHVVELKELGVPLADIEAIINRERDAEETRLLLLARRRDSAEEAAAARSRIERIDTYLAGLARDEQMSKAVTALAVDVKAVETRLVAQMTAVAESWAPADIGPVIQPLYPELISRMAVAEVTITGPSTAWYADTAEGRLAVHATLTIAERPGFDTSVFGFEIAELTGLPKVASTIHRGTMANCDTTYHALLAWIEHHGYRPLDYGREIDIQFGPERPWITELQIPIEALKENQS